MEKEKYSKAYLFKGMCSNGPLVGMVPHKLLLETSTTLRLVTPVSSLGIGPFNRLSLSRKNTRDFNFPKETGILPVILLLYRSKLMRLFKFPSSSGIVPWMLFL